MKIVKMYYLFIGSIGILIASDILLVSGAPRTSRYTYQYNNNVAPYQYNRNSQNSFSLYSTSSPSSSSQYVNTLSNTLQYTVSPSNTLSNENSLSNANQYRSSSSSNSTQYTTTSYNTRNNNQFNSYNTNTSSNTNNRYNNNGYTYNNPTNNYYTANNEDTSRVIITPAQNVIEKPEHSISSVNNSNILIIDWLNDTLKEIEIDPIKDANVNCTNAEDFPFKDFSTYGDIKKVYTKPTNLEENSIFYPMGFTKYVRVFGIPLLGTNDVNNLKLSHAAKLLAEYIDNNKDNIPDNIELLEKLLNYTLVLGFVGGPAESQFFWNERYLKSTSKSFREQFVCNMHFFEQWNSEIVPNFHITSYNESEKCRRISGIAFDWLLWYYPFTLTYYGYFDLVSNDTKIIIENAMNKAVLNNKFYAKYPDDTEMNMAEFFAWAYITKLSALNCICESKEIQDYWRICTAKDLYEFDNELFKILDNFSFFPKILPSGNYDLSDTLQNNNNTIISHSSENNTFNTTSNQNIIFNNAMSGLQMQTNNSIIQHVINNTT